MEPQGLVLVYNKKTILLYLRQIGKGFEKYESICHLEKMYVLGFLNR